MPQNQKKQTPEDSLKKRIHSIKVIYNPHAGTKRRILPNPYPTTSLEDIKYFLKKYQLEVDFYPTEYPGHATKLAKKAIKEGYKTVLVAGGDGTVGEAANGLVGSNVNLGILPLGSFMNIARMLFIPLDLEKAVMLIKLGKTRKIDLGVVVSMGGKKLEQPHYFIESSGIGLEAQLHQHILDLERGNLKSFYYLLKTLFDYYGHKGKVIIDDKEISTRASLVNVSNGPFSGAALPLAPEAKLNDHRLTVSLFRMSNIELLKHFLRLFFGFKPNNRKKITTYQAKKVIIETRIKRMVHADARLYGETPIEYAIVPNALNVYTGFISPDEEIITLKKKTLLDP